MDYLKMISETYNNLIQIPEVKFIGHIVGLLGMSCIVIAYYLIERGKLDRGDARYYVLNLAGAALLEVSLLINFNLGSFVIEIFWIAISIVGLLRIQRAKIQN